MNKDDILIIFALVLFYIFINAVAEEIVKNRNDILEIKKNIGGYQNLYNLPLDTPNPPLRFLAAGFWVGGIV